MGDPLRIHQVLMNLLSNAMKFTDKGSVRLDIQENGKDADGRTLINFKVSDTGIGIPEEKLDLVFEKFTQADSSITRRFGGSGLGLAITRACVEKMEGTIGIESQLGIGTTFSVTIPLKDTGRSSNVESFSARTSPGQEKLKKNVLLVEDYEPNILVAVSMLEHFGFEYEVAKNGLDAVRKFVNGYYDVILMDVQMNELDGLQATRRIRALEKEKNLPRTPIVAMTAHVREQDKDRCFDAGMDDFIPKPFEPGILAQKIGRYLDQGVHTGNNHEDKAGNKN
jgi:CheY-like chemotaxis protein